MKKQTWIGELGDDVRKLIKNSWKQTILIIAIASLGLTGFKCEWGKFKIEKDPIIEYKPGEVKK